MTGQEPEQVIFTNCYHCGPLKGISAFAADFQFNSGFNGPENALLV